MATKKPHGYRNSYVLLIICPKPKLLYYRELEQWCCNLQKFRFIVSNWSYFCQKHHHGNESSVTFSLQSLCTHIRNSFRTRLCSIKLKLEIVESNKLCGQPCCIFLTLTLITMEISEKITWIIWTIMTGSCALTIYCSTCINWCCCNAFKSALFFFLLSQSIKYWFSVRATN